MAVAAAGVVALAGCSGDPERPPAPTPSETSDEAAAGTEPQYIFYLLGRQLLRFKIKSSYSKIIEDLPSEQVAVSPDGTQAVFVQESSAKPPKEGDEFREPIIRIGTALPGLAAKGFTLGLGEMPVWSPLDGSSIAAINLDGEEVLLDASQRVSQKGKPLPAGELWAELAWDPEGTLADIADLDAEDVLVATMAPDGRSVAAVTEPGVVLIDAETAETTEVPRSKLANQVVWGPDSESFAYARTTKRGFNDVFLCRSATDCKNVFSWKEPVRLVALTS